MHYLKYLLYIAAVFIVFLSSCNRNEFTTSASDQLTFSTDTVFFDTVFTSIGSSTRRFKVYNPHNENIRISSLKLARGSSSYYRLNVNGVPGTEFKNIEIRGKDSIFIFADVNINPQNSNTPFVVTDSLEFTTNGNFQDVKLVAFGRDAIFHKPNEGQSSFVLTCDDVWTSDKPHVVYGIALIDSACDLTINAGTNVYFHNNGALVALNSASIKVNGTKDQPVTFSGDRLEPRFSDIPGQWRGIYLFPLSAENEFNWAVIKNAQIGIQADTVNSTVSNLPTVTINNSIIQNCSSIGLSGRGTFIKAYNSVFANCGEFCASLSLGGNYSFTHCTFANYRPGGFDKSAVLLNNWFQDNNRNINPRDLEQANFTNCIIYGSLFSEVSLSKVEGASFNYNFTNSLVRVLQSDVDFEGPEFVNCITNLDPFFTEPQTNNFNLQQNSNALNIGNIDTVNAKLPGLEFDLNNNSRIADALPDAGAFEYIPE